MIAALLMYDRPETAAAHDALWQGVRAAHPGRLPTTLTRGVDPRETWRHPDLALGHVCGYPFRTEYPERLVYVGTGVYDITAPPGYYHSLWLCRRDDSRTKLASFDGATLAYNERGSFSGFIAPHRAASAAGIAFGTFAETGAHVDSAAAVAQGRADLAAVDAVTWRAIARHDGFAQGLRVLGATPDAPGLAFVTAPGHDAERMHDALAAAIADLDPAHRDASGLQGLVRIPLAEYDDAHRTPEIRA